MVPYAAVGVACRWDEDAVFKNCARGMDLDGKRLRPGGGPAQPEFINDTLRSDFHRKFLTRYIK